MKKILLFTTLLIPIFNSILAQQFTARYNGTGNGIDAVKAMVVDNAGNTYVTGSSFSPANSDDYVTIKYNSSFTYGHYNGCIINIDIAAGNVSGNNFHPLRFR